MKFLYSCKIGFTSLSRYTNEWKKKLCKKGANYLSKVCAIYHENKGEIKLEKIESEIKIDNSVEE